MNIPGDRMVEHYIMCNVHPDLVASGFEREPPHLAICYKCRLSSPGSLDARPDPGALLSCICGEPLDGAIVHGVWMMGDVACEYRTCRHCSSTRAWAAVDEVPGRRIGLYLDGDTSEVEQEYTSLLDATEEGPFADGAELRRNGVLLAKAFRTVDGHTCWRFLPPTREIPLDKSIKVK